MNVWASETGRIIKVETHKDRGTYAKRSFKTKKKSTLNKNPSLLK